MLNTVLHFLDGGSPDCTAAQVAAVAVAGLPFVAMLLSAFEVFDAD